MPKHFTMAYLVLEEILNIVRPQKESKGIKNWKVRGKIDTICRFILGSLENIWESIATILQNKDNSAGSKVNIHKSIASIYTSKTAFQSHEKDNVGIN